MNEGPVTDDPTLWPCQIRGCKNSRLRMRAYEGNSYGLDCHVHSICVKCKRSTNGWTCRMCESCDKKYVTPQ